MNCIIPMILFTTICTIAGAQPATTERPDSLKEVHRIVCLGDSITQGGEGPGGYVWLIRDYLKKLFPAGGGEIEVANAGISGNRSNDMLERFNRDVIDKHPDLITISVGVNDVWHGFYDNHPRGDGPRGITLDKYRANVQEMVNRAKEAHARVAIMSTTVIHEDLEGPENAKLVSYNAALRDIAKKNGAIFIDLQKPFKAMITTYRKETGARDLLLTVDGVHMNGLGNKVMAYSVLAGLGITPDARAVVQGQVEADIKSGR